MIKKLEMKKLKIMKNILTLLLFVCTNYTLLNAQTKTEAKPAIIFKGKITYERKLNMHKQMDGMLKDRPEMASMIEMFKKQMSKYKTDIFEMTFTDKKSIYKPAKDGITESKSMMGNLPSERNIIFNNYETKESVAEKKVFEKTYLMKDSFKKFEWKIKEEFKTIAGFSCRRAETIIMDSVYVIAYYSDAIIANGGPESFNGLPGMVLGIVMPRLNITYFATQVDNFIADENIIEAPSKGTEKTMAELTTSIKESTAQWGDFAQRILWYINI